MRIEAFSEAKRPNHPERNEDTFVVIPGRAYAVIDGATDRSGLLYDGGVTSGWLASAAVAASLHAVFGMTRPRPFDPAAVIAAATTAIAGEYRRLGMLDDATREPNRRFSATLALAVPEGDALHLLLVGDSGIRINGTALHQDGMLLDAIVASLRVGVYRTLEAAGVAQTEVARTAAIVTSHGTRHSAEQVAPALSAEDLAAIEAAVVAQYRGSHPAIPAEAVRALVQGGILLGQPPHRNNAASPLGYSCLDGFGVAEALTRHVRLLRDEVHSIELFTDGYFLPGDAVGVASWEAMFARIEREDPEKTGRFASVKGSGADGSWTDDRTYVCVIPDRALPDRSRDRSTTPWPA